MGSQPAQRCGERTDGHRRKWRSTGWSDGLALSALPRSSPRGRSGRHQAPVVPRQRMTSTSSRGSTSAMWKTSSVTSQAHSVDFALATPPGHSGGAGVMAGQPRECRLAGASGDASTPRTDCRARESQAQPLARSLRPPHRSPGHSQAAVRDQSQVAQQRQRRVSQDD